MIGLDQQILLDLLMRGQLPPGLFGIPGAGPITPPGSSMPGMAGLSPIPNAAPGGFDPSQLVPLSMGGPTPTATPGIAGPMPAAMPETVLPPVRPGLKDIWRGIGAHHEGVDLPADVARTNRNAGLLDAGIALLAGAGRQQPGEAIATGLSAFRGGIDREAESYLKRSRENEEFDLTRRSAEESITASEAARKRAEAAEGRAAGEYGYTQESREGARSAMKDLVREVEEISGKDSEEADRARALFKGGPALFGDLEKLHTDVLSRKRAPEIAGEATEAEIERRKRLYAEDPDAIFKRGIESRQVAAYEKSVGRYGTGSGREPSAQQFNDDVRQEANVIYDMLVDEAKDAREAAELAGTFPAPEINYREIRDRSEREAEARVRRRYDSVGTAAGGASPGSPLGIDEEALPVAVQSVKRVLPPTLQADPRIEEVIEAQLRAGKSATDARDFILNFARSKGLL